MRILLFGAALLLAQAAVRAAPPVAVCSLDVPVVEPRQAATASVLAGAPASGALRYEWKAGEGALSDPGLAATEWRPNGAAEGPHKLSVTVTAPDGSSGSCTLVILVGREIRSGPATGGWPRQIRSAMLLPGKKEEEQFGLYSYMLLGSKPNSSNEERYKAFLKAFGDTVAPYDRMKDEVHRQQLNITYAPVLRDPPEGSDEQWLLKNYDFDRAKRLLERIPGTHLGDGPYIVSVKRPLEDSDRAADKPLVEDLSTVPVSMVKLWVNQFRAQTAQERWDQATLTGVAVQIRTYLEYAATGYPEVINSLKSLVSAR